MAFNAEAEVKLLRIRLEGLERKLETTDKTVRALPDLAAIAKLPARLTAAEQAIALKKDAKTADQKAEEARKATEADAAAAEKRLIDRSIKDAEKMAAEMKAFNKQLQLVSMFETRIKVLEVQMGVALAKG